jgi:hypothetical protein
VREVVRAPDPGARPAAAAPSAPRTRPTSAPASLRPATSGRLAGSARRDHARSSAAVDRHAPGPAHGAQATAPTATGALPAQASQQSPGAKGQAIGQAKRQAAASNGRRATPKVPKSHPARHAAGRSPAASLPKAHPTHPKHPLAAAPAPHEPPAGAQDERGPADSTPPGNSGAHAVK